MKSILIIDNYDSFTYNLEQQLGSFFDGKIVVKRNDAIKLLEVINFDAIVISPGPGRPEDVHLTNAIIKRYYAQKPILGICLGMQCINELFAGKTSLADYPMHGKISTISHDKMGLFKNIPPNIKVARYHSLICDVNNDKLQVTARNNDGVIMAIRHKTLPIFGVQFHPESFLTEFGDKMMKNFLELI
ncbi:MAG: aminodeoxychorismate/anthranilate synthase component II [Candidatus Cloacimonetes bacterium]|jgi:anthranilate synthase/aminodeoxychorismate synthase-like glutamine amidotransferase|nr:aminodeoxychorismate/anthranilate synthase component II [Candidatus Cloacimonadota bacterium]MBT6993518.1 aminodeoxychorismate/anthranilate synthase component II [Candidatus Cloacimonadota bacterium]MBT7469510.1 aminodeoxychorismate/anthranilate synthase component II [Candidatus Cloacimonadota bacterium]